MLAKILCWPFYMPVKLVQTAAFCCILLAAAVIVPYEVKLTGPWSKK